MTNKNLTNKNSTKKNKYTTLPDRNASSFNLTFLLIFNFLLCVLFLASCQPDLYQGNAAHQIEKEQPIGKADIKYAKGFSIVYYKNFKQVNIYNYEGTTKDTAQYLLIKRGGVIPEGFPKAHIIETPVRSIIGMSSMHVALIDFAEADAVLTGLGNLKYASAQKVRKAIEAGKIKEVGQETNLNNEMVLTMHPDLIMAVGNVNAKVNRFSLLTDAGIPVIQNSEFLESTPLGRAEWVKLMAVLVDKEDLVNKKFDAVELEYQRLVHLAKKAAHQPHVITGMPVKGTWYMPQGNSYLTHFIEDAGGYTKWAKEEGIGSLPLSFEVVAPEALQADYWINIGYVSTKADMTARDHRFADFKPFKTGQVYNFNKKINEVGANDYWESGAVNPQRVLSDLIKIIHPDLLPKYELTYYQQLK